MKTKGSKMNGNWRYSVNKEKERRKKNLNPLHVSNAISAGTSIKVGC